MSQVTFREQFRGQEFAHLFNDDALKADVVIRVAGQLFMRYHWRCSLSYIFHAC